MTVNLRIVSCLWCAMCPRHLNSISLYTIGKFLQPTCDDAFQCDFVDSRVFLVCPAIKKASRALNVACRMKNDVEHVEERLVGRRLQKFILTEVNTYFQLGIEDIFNLKYAR